MIDADGSRVLRIDEMRKLLSRLNTNGNPSHTNMAIVLRALVERIAVLENSVIPGEGGGRE